MTNEEKAKEIAKSNCRVYNVSLVNNRVKRMTSENECYESAKEMARFKDEQFINIISYLEGRMGDEISVKMIEIIKCNLLKNKE